jgi:anti-sigma regulatory factor (Ser/Thr protein kinase)
VSGPVAAIYGNADAPLRASAELRFAIPSTPAALAASVEMVRATMEWMVLEPEWIFRAELCLQEALVNALFHGNQADTGREIRVGCSLSSSKVEIDVEDEGEGYDARQCLSAPPTGDTCGRGLYLIRQFMNSVAIQGNGTRIVMSLNKE